MKRKLIRAYMISINRYQKFLDELETNIALSRIGKMNLARTLGIPYKTFYRKLNGQTFTKTELLKLTSELDKANAAKIEKLNLMRGKKNKRSN